MAAQQSDDYHQEKVLKLTDELESLSVAQPAKKSTPKEPDIDTGLANIYFMPRLYK